MKVASRARRVALLVSAALVATIGVVATTAATATTAGALPACTKTWTSAVSGSWDDGTKWSGGTVPLPTDHVCITTAGQYTVTLPDGGLSVIVASLKLGTPTGAHTETLLVARGVATDATSLTATQGIEIAQTGALVLDESTDAQVSVGVGASAIVANDGAIGQEVGVTRSAFIRGDVVNTGNFRLDAPMFVEGDFTNEGLLQDNHVLHVAGTMWTKSGGISGEWAIVSQEGLRVGDAVIGTPGQRPVFSVYGGELSFESEQPIEVVVYGDVTVDGDAAPNQNIGLQNDDADTTLTFTGTWTNRGIIDLQPAVGRDVSIVGSGPLATLVNEGGLGRFSDAGGTANVAAQLVNRGGVDTGDGTLHVGDVEGEGYIDLGLGRLESGGRVDLEPSSVIHVDVDGSSAGVIAADEPVTVDGVLETTTDTAPSVGSVLPLVTAPGRSGTFDELVFFGSASYDPQYATHAVNLVRRASESGSRRFVRAAYQDFLDRQPTSAQLSQRAAAIDGGTLTRASLVRQLSLSEEYVTALVQRFYADTLGRPGDPGGVTFWVGQLRSGRKTVAEVAGSFYASDEFFDRAGGTRADWIDDLYLVFFERLPSTTDRAFWVARAQDRGRTRVAIELFQSLESRRQRVGRLYIELLGRPGEPGGVDYWAGRIAREGDLALAVNLASSPEYFDRAATRYP